MLLGTKNSSIRERRQKYKFKKVNQKPCNLNFELIYYYESLMYFPLAKKKNLFPSSVQQKGLEARTNPVVVSTPSTLNGL